MTLVKHTSMKTTSSSTEMQQQQQREHLLLLHDAGNGDHTDTTKKTAGTTTTTNRRCLYYVSVLVAMMMVVVMFVTTSNHLLSSSLSRRSTMMMSTTTTTPSMMKSTTTTTTEKTVLRSSIVPCSRSNSDNNNNNNNNNGDNGVVSTLYDTTGQLKSQSAEDEELLKLFSGGHEWCNGTYIELGGLDGVTFSNSYVFNKVFGWKGVLIEASPINYKDLVVNRPNEIATVNAGVCAVPQTLHWVDRGPVGGFAEFATQTFKDIWWTEESKANAQEVMCQPLTTILDDVFGRDGSFHFDFFSLDVEGAEYEVLQSLDFNKYSFGIIFVESDDYNRMKNMAVRMLLESNGYTFLKFHQRSDWFINKNWWDIYKNVIH
jgi:FkbM family methyltransferase